MTSGRVPRSITLESVSHRLLYKLEDTAISHVMTGAIPDTKRVQNCLTSEQQLSPELAARVSGWILYWLLGIAEYLTVNNKPVVEIVPTADNVIPYRNVRAAAAEPMYQAVAADFSNLTFVLFSENWNDEDLIVLAGMAAGLPRLRTHANYAHHLPSLAINSPPINFVCYGAGERVLQPWNLVNSGAVKSVLGKLATSRNENDQYVHGFIRAVTLAFRWVLSHNNTYALSSTLFEINTIPICAPGDSNWM
ncbi:hypothetical protein GJ496_006385 [Pomphorhynchus laevis]|nr:hypothetical protein GJ496_006385 [Pomphorhynchus laevis]